MSGSADDLTDRLPQRCPVSSASGMASFIYASRRPPRALFRPLASFEKVVSLGLANSKSLGKETTKLSNTRVQLFPTFVVKKSWLASLLNCPLRRVEASINSCTCLFSTKLLQLVHSFLLDPVAQVVSVAVVFAQIFPILKKIKLHIFTHTYRRTHRHCIIEWWACEA
ncbi:unnamed protein product [Protopolystoma xenopodis]|uniref:Uncharacterized protein n=1 Tax=Protopolystoma xenopodis TaxID=117903 RepID=A0A3S5BLS1_9PLAT|nr:unnamed protein product [Protopolystoma xenopodis]